LLAETVDVIQRQSADTFRLGISVVIFVLAQTGTDFQIQGVDSAVQRAVTIAHGSRQLLIEAAELVELRAQGGKEIGAVIQFVIQFVAGQIPFRGLRAVILGHSRRCIEPVAPFLLFQSGCRVQAEIAGIGVPRRDHRAQPHRSGPPLAFSDGHGVVGAGIALFHFILGCHHPRHQQEAGDEQCFSFHFFTPSL